MMKWLKKHPFAVEAHFESSLVLTFALTKEQLLPLIPPCLELDTFQNKWAFVAVALVQTRDLRPKGFPAWLGNDFFLIGYRIFVRYTTNAGKRLRGLHIIKSQTNKKKMQLLGNIFTHYKYSTIDINQSSQGTLRTITSNKSNFNISINTDKTKVEIPIHSPFSDWTNARRFAGPLPYTFSVNPTDRTILIILGMRKNWKPKPVKVENYSIDFFQELGLQDPILASAFEVTNVPYCWDKGKLEKWK